MQKGIQPLPPWESQLLGAAVDDAQPCVVWGNLDLRVAFAPDPQPPCVVNSHKSCSLQAPHTHVWVKRFRSPYQIVHQGVVQCYITHGLLPCQLQTHFAMPRSISRNSRLITYRVLHQATPPIPTECLLQSNKLSTHCTLILDSVTILMNQHELAVSHFPFPSLSC